MSSKKKQFDQGDDDNIIGETSTKRSKGGACHGDGGNGKERPVAEHFYSPSSNLITLICIKHQKHNNDGQVDMGGGDFSLYISGFCNITLYKGSAVINGYSLPVNKPTPLAAPMWTPSAELFLSRSIKSERNKTISAVFTSMMKNDIINRFPDIKNEILITKTKSNKPEMLLYEAYDCVLYIEGVPDDDQEWMVAAEDRSVYSVQRFLDRTAYDSTGIAEYKYSSSSDIFLRPIESALVERSPSLLSYFGLHPVTYDSSWIESSDIIAKAARSRSSESSSPRAVICGAKGVGKSTCLRYNVNKLLSSNKYVCVIDCDVGQPEMSPPGMVSMHIVSKPILAPSYLNISEPYISYFYGDITPRNDPGFLSRIVLQLYSCYENVLAEYQHSGKIEPFNSSNTNRNTWKDSAASNVYAALLDAGGGGEDHPGDGKDKRNLPLLVNCDGFIRYMGEEILTAITQIVRPSHLLHIVTEKDRNLPAVDALRAEGSCKVFELIPGSFTASNIASVDLRILRLVSYFLRDNINLKKHTINSTNSIYIRTGALVDNYGFIAYELSQSRCLCLPLRDIAIRSLSQEVQPSLVLAALNASIVGLVGSVRDYGSAADSGGVTFSRLHHKPSNTTFSLDCSGTFSDTAPCHGLAIIRSIDVPATCALAICPSAVSSRVIACGQQSGYTYGGSKILVVRSNIVVPLLFLFGLRMPYLPYLSAELAGEGKASMKGRANVKRR